MIFSKVFFYNYALVNDCIVLFYICCMVVKLDDCDEKELLQFVSVYSLSVWGDNPHDTLLG